MLSWSFVVPVQTREGIVVNAKAQSRLHGPCVKTLSLTIPLYTEIYRMIQPMVHVKLQKKTHHGARGETDTHYSM
jgi:hypothetical protein